MLNRQGFEAYVASAGGRVHRMAYLLTRDHGLAEDLVQSALARACVAWRRVDGDPEPYVRNVVPNAFLSSSRRRWWAERSSADFAEEFVPDGYAGIDDRPDLGEALGRLPPRQRAVVVPRYAEDLSERHVAELRAPVVAGPIRRPTRCDPAQRLTCTNAG